MAAGIVLEGKWDTAQGEPQAADMHSYLKSERRQHVKLVAVMLSKLQNKPPFYPFFNRKNKIPVHVYI